MKTKIKIHGKFVKLPDAQEGPCDGCNLSPTEIYRTSGLTPAALSFFCINCLRPILESVDVEVKNCLTCMSILLDDPFYADPPAAAFCKMCELLKFQQEHKPLKRTESIYGVN